MLDLRAELFRFGRDGRDDPLPQVGRGQLRPAAAIAVAVELQVDRQEMNLLETALGNRLGL